MAADYTDLLPNRNVNKPKFKAWISALTTEVGLIADTILGIPVKFDVDTAIGVQLDADGLWVGASRRVEVPLAIFFSLDTPGLGFDEGVWKGPFDPDSGVQTLDDKTFRAVIKSRIAANNWDGTTSMYQTLAVDALAGTGTVLIATDNQDMTMTVHVSGTPLTPIMQAVLEAGQLVTKPGGVSISYT